MKKFLLVLAIGAFVACNDNSNADEKATDTIPAAPAPVEPVAPALDSAAAVVDSAASAVVDSLKK
ncbi:MAG: hypothetical protein JNL51_18140 [Chitinophagaceae bacterium]|nr:hypothetical protein [Chitinophagaceae bacterium]